MKKSFITHGPEPNTEPLHVMRPTISNELTKTEQIFIITVKPLKIHKKGLKGKW